VHILISRRSEKHPELVHIIEDFSFPLELGRQKEEKEPLYAAPTCQNADRRWRVVIAPIGEQTVGRQHVLLERDEQIPGGKLRVTNTSSASTIRLADGTLLNPGEARECSLTAGGLEMVLGTPVLVRIGEGPSPLPLGELPRPTSAPGSQASHPERLGVLPTLRVPGVEVHALVEWLRQALDVLQCSDFYRRATQAVVAMADMDSARVLLRDKNEWTEVRDGVAFRDGEQNRGARPPSRRILNKLLTERKTVWELPPDQERWESVVHVRAIVAAPILDARGEVIGVLYGDRHQANRKAISEVEALLVELIASGVAAGLERAAHERTTERFEQFFTPELARKLAEDPELIQKGRSMQVTMLFCDIRKFSSISERVGAEQTIAWISDVMATLSDCVNAEEGTLVDYIGDELMAMWGAPDPQEDHAARACRAGLAMLNRLPELNERWQEKLGEAMAFGIGINSGEAQVGNTGSPRKFKYGPLGNTVNLASRVQGATKHLKTPLLITEETFKQLTGDLRARARRLCTVQVVNIKEEVTLFDFVSPAAQGMPDRKGVYESALVKFENEDFRGAARLLPALTAEPTDDGPSIVLLFRAVQGMKDGKADKHPVWELPSK
jgi:adenylate cyclase